MIEFILNNQHIKTGVSPTTVLLDFIRKEKKLTGTKEGCREGDCGACTILLGELVKGKLCYTSVNSCLMPLGDAYGKHVVTVEGLNQDELSPVQAGMIDEGGTQCGFCTPGFVISMTGYFLSNAVPKNEAAVDALGGNICRCTGYAGIKRAAEHSISAYEKTDTKSKLIDRLIEAGFVPAYFKTIKKELAAISMNRNKDSKTEYLVSGGTDLYVQQWESLVQSKANFTSIRRTPNEIIKVKDKIKIGGAATIQQVLDSPIVKKHYPALQKNLELFGSLPIRNRATVAGNIVNASPIGDMTNILLALNAELQLKNGKSKRSVKLRDFYKGYKLLNKKKNESIDWITIPVPSIKILFNYEKVSKRTYLDIASVNSSIFLEEKNNIIKSIGLSAGGVAPIPFYLKKTSEFLTGKKISSTVVKDAAGIALKEISPISDARGSAEYKKLLLRQLIFAHFIVLFPRVINEEEII